MNILQYSGNTHTAKIFCNHSVTKLQHSPKKHPTKTFFPPLHRGALQSLGISNLVVIIRTCLPIVNRPTWQRRWCWSRAAYVSERGLEWAFFICPEIILPRIFWFHLLAVHPTLPVLSPVLAVPRTADATHKKQPIRNLPPLNDLILVSPSRSVRRPERSSSDRVVSHLDTFWSVCVRDLSFSVSLGDAGSLLFVNCNALLGFIQKLFLSWTVNRC